jgi:hypothetical protein
MSRATSHFENPKNIEPMFKQIRAMLLSLSREDFLAMRKRIGEFYTVESLLKDESEGE